MNAPVGKQSIRCSVASCKHHAHGMDYCELSSIVVKPKQGGSSGKAADESLCASYHSEG